ncbi:long-chain fatty acid-CoA ligase [Fusarium oxysporum]|nr:long-chain fatty acid-CoA ligase [Fusarium oxysporum]
MGLKWAVQSVQWPWTGPPGPAKLLDWTGLNRRSSPGAHYGPPISHTGQTVLVEKIKGLGVDEHSMHYAPKVHSLILKDLQTAGKRSGLAGMEIVSDIVITDEEWTPLSGLVTATHKLNRKVIREKFKKEIDECLKNSP